MASTERVREGDSREEERNVSAWWRHERVCCKGVGWWRVVFFELLVQGVRGLWQE